MAEVVSDPPEKGKTKQFVDVVGEAALSSVPVVGGPLAVLWVQLAGAAYERRRQAWAHEITEAVNELLAWADDVKAEDLAASDQFLDSVHMRPQPQSRPDTGKSLTRCETQS